jgi:hypothetical protein
MLRSYCLRLAVAVTWLITIGSCCVAGMHRGTIEDPVDPIALSAFYAAGVVALVLTTVYVIAYGRSKT